MSPARAVAESAEWSAVFVEQFGVIGEEIGLPRTMTRLLGWLVVCDPPYQSAQQIQAGLRLSAGSVSTGMNDLVRGGLAERLTFPGDRHVYYRIGPDGWRGFLAGRLRVLGEIRRIADRAMAAAGDLADSRLQDLRDFYARSEQLFTKLLEQPGS